MSEEFNKAAEDAKAFTKKPTDEELLKLYGLFKQATVGDVNTDRPGMLDFKGKAKWDAWDANKGKDKATSEQEYIALVASLKEKYAYAYRQWRVCPVIPLSQEVQNYFSILSTILNIDIP